MGVFCIYRLFHYFINLTDALSTHVHLIVQALKIRYKWVVLLFFSQNYSQLFPQNPINGSINHFFSLLKENDFHITDKLSMIILVIMLEITRNRRNKTIRVRVMFQLFCIRFHTRSCSLRSFNKVVLSVLVLHFCHQQLQK